MNQLHDPATEYQSVAPFYDLLIAPLLLPEYRQAGALARQIGARTVVDLCCGTGALARHMGKQGFQVTGVDLSPSMLRQARDKNSAGMTFILADAAWTGLPAHHFDLAVISMALHEKPALLRDQILTEAKHLITPDGHILLMDYAIPLKISGRIMHHLAAIIERMAGKEHHAHYRSYLHSGGLDHLIRHNNLHIQSQTSFHHGLIQVCLTRISNGSHT